MEHKMAKAQFKARAELVKQERIRRAWPQGQLAEVCNLSLRTIQRLEKEGAASFETLMAVAEVFKMDVEQLNPTSRTQKKASSQKKVHLMPRLTSGKDLVDIVGGADRFQIEHDAVDDERALGAMMSMLEEIKRDIVRWHDADFAGKLKIERYLSQALKEIDAYGFYLFGVLREIPRSAGSQQMHVRMCTIYMSHSRSPKIVRDKKFNMAIPAVLTEVAP